MADPEKKPLKPPSGPRPLISFALGGPETQPLITLPNTPLPPPPQWMQGLGHFAAAYLGAEGDPTAPIGSEPPSWPVLAGMAAGMLPGPRMLGALGRGLFSRVDEALKLLPLKGAHPNKVLSILKSNASAEELAFRKVPEWLAAQGNKAVTPEMLAAHLQAHPAPMPVVVTKGVSPADQAQKRVEQAQSALEEYLQREQAFSAHGVRDYTLDAARGELSPSQLQAAQSNPQQWALTQQLREAYEARRATGTTGATPTKFGNYTVPGGENYRETLLTLPARGGVSAAELRAMGPGPMTAEQIRAQAARGSVATPEFHSSHFDEPNIVVHTRSNERTLPTGERGRFVEEVQSDWHQAGKKVGYQPSAPDALPQLQATQRDGYWEVNTDQGDFVTNVYGSDAATPEAAIAEAQRRMYRQPMRTATDPRVPDVPFKENWPDLGLKQQLLETANDPEAQWLGFTSGQTQAERYDLSKQFSRVEFDAGDRQLRAFDHTGREVLSQTTGPEQLADYIGNEGAEKLLTSTPSLHPDDQTPLYSLTGVDLQVGGEGMHYFYDQLLRKRMEKILKPFGGTVERGALPTPFDYDRAQPDDLAAAVFQAARVGPAGSHLIDGKLPMGRYQTLTTQAQLAQRFRMAGNQVLLELPTSLRDAVTTGSLNTPSWIARLTPEMKARIQREGLPLMSLVPLSQVGAPPEDRR
jgi:hypothetical protein